jgi:hypothetical protein
MKNQRSLSPFCGFLASAIMLLVLMTRASYAGQWTLDSFVYHGTTHSETQTWGWYGFAHEIKHPGAEKSVPESAPIFREARVPISPQEGSSGSFAISSSLFMTSSLAGGQTANSTGWPIKAAKTSVVVTVRPVFVWRRNNIYTPGVGDSPDPNDNPVLSQRIYIYEESQGRITRRHSGGEPSYSAANPFRGTWMPMQRLDNGLKSPITEDLSDYGGITNHSVGGRVRFIPVNKIRIGIEGKEFFDGPAINLKGIVESQARSFIRWEQASAQVSFHYNIRMMGFQFRTRRKGSTEDPKILNGFSSYASIAAGHQKSDEHQAEILMRVTMAGGPDLIGMPGLSLSQLPKLRLHNEKGVEKDAKLLPPSDPDTPAAERPADLTDSSGFIIVNRVLSRDLITLNSGHTYATLADNVYAPTGVHAREHVMIYQNWDDQNQWEMPSYLLGTENSVPVKFRPKFGDVSIKGHTMKMLVAKVKISIANGFGARRTKIITSNPAEVNSQVSPPIVLGDPQNFAAFEETTVTDEETAGVYRGTLKFPQSEQATVEQLWFKAQDQGVYIPPTPATP